MNSWLLFVVAARPYVATATAQSTDWQGIHHFSSDDSQTDGTFSEIFLKFYCLASAHL